MLYETALERIRQLSAHEVGHTLGLGHNYYDSEQGLDLGDGLPASAREAERRRHDRPVARPTQARIGDWDKVTINYGYRQFPPGTDETAALTKILDDAWAQDLRYLTNQDTDSHPRVDQWSNGVNQADELNRLMKVRRAALEPHRRAHDPRRRADGDDRRAAGADLHVSPLRGRERGVDARRPGLHLRACAATAARRRSGSRPTNQRKALDALAATLKPSELTVPKPVLDADSAAAAGLRHAPRAVPAHDRRQRSIR